MENTLHVVFFALGYHNILCVPENKRFVNFKKKRPKVI